MRCKHCQDEIKKIPFALGERWMHINRVSSFPTQMNGGLWWHCKLTVATPKEK